MRVAALLRGINIGSHNRLAMPTLRAIVADLGHTDIETYLQSGNAVFTPSGGLKDGLGEQLAAALTAATGLDIGVVVRTGAELDQVVAGCPYEVDDPTRVVVAFFGAPMGARELGLADPTAYAPDALTLAERHAYVSVPNGQARSKLLEQLTRRPLPAPVTVRNWRTVMALHELTR